MSGRKRWTALFTGVLFQLFLVCSSQDVFSEEVLTTWLTPRHLMVHLRFDQATTASRLHTSFPHAIQHLVSTLPLHGVELALTSGRWRYSEWGWPLMPAKPIGAALEASFYTGLRPQQLDATWSALVHTLSGLTCVSLSQLARRGDSVTAGRIGFQVAGPAPRLTSVGSDRGGNGGGGEVAAAAGGDGAGNGSTVVPATAVVQCGIAGGLGAGSGGGAAGHCLRALLPREALCTENLTPWLRLLPCRDRAGLAALLRHRPTVFGADYVSLGLRMDRATSGKGRSGVRAQMTFTFVVRTALPAAARGHDGDGPYSGVLDLEELLGGARVGHFCPAATRSQVFVAVPPPAAYGNGAGSGGIGNDNKDGSGGDVVRSSRGGHGSAGGGSASCSLTGEDDGNVQACPAASASAVEKEPNEMTPSGEGVTGRGAGGDVQQQELQQLGGVLLTPRLRHHNGITPAPPVADTVCRTLPQLLLYDTLDLLETLRPEAKGEEGGGSGLHLRLPRPPERPMGWSLAETRRVAAVTAAAHVGRRIPSATWRPAAIASASPSAGAGASGGSATHGSHPDLVVPGPAHLTVERFVTGAGLLRGGMVLRVGRSQSLMRRLARGPGGAGAGACGADTGGGGGDGGEKAMCVSHVLCVQQTFPWYVRPWIHTLVVQYDGQVVTLHDHLVAQHIQPSLQRSLPGDLDLCLHAPPHVTEVTLKLAFSKAFLNVLEYPPDAHRGFDIPAAVVSYRLDDDALMHAGAAVQWQVSSRDRGDGSGGGDSNGGGQATDDDQRVVSPLLAALTDRSTQVVFTSGLLVLLAAPDFSMPYNVMCLSSTLLVVYLGVVVTLLTRRCNEGGEGTGDGVMGAIVRRRRKRLKAVKMVVLMLLFCGLAVYLDPDLREQLETGLASLGIKVQLSGVW